MRRGRTHPDGDRPAVARAARIFISYSRDDTDWVHDLLRAGDRCGDLELCSFPYEAAQDEDWRQVVLGLIRGADGLVCLVGARTLQNANIAWELDEATRSGIPILLAGHEARTIASRRRGDRVYTLENSSPATVLARLRELT